MLLIGERDLQRGVDRLRAGIAEEHMIEIARRERRDAARQLERLRMRELERRRVVELGGLLLDRRDDRIAVVAGVAAPHAGRAVHHGFAVHRVVVHVLGARDQPRRLLECAVGRERHPEGLEIVRDGCDGAGGKRHRVSSWEAGRLLLLQPIPSLPRTRNALADGRPEVCARGAAPPRCTDQLPHPSPTDKRKLSRRNNRDAGAPVCRL